MRLFHNIWILIGFIAFTALTIYILPKDSSYLHFRYASTSFLLLFLLGFTVIQYLFPKKKDLDIVERIALSIGMSLVLIPLLGLVLNYTPLGINQDSVFISLVLLTISIAITAAIRRSRLKVEADSLLSEIYTGLELKSILCAAFPIVIATFLRVYPYLISGLPFSVDAWPSIRYTEILLDRTPIHLGDEETFGQRYEQLGDRLFGAVMSSLSGLSPIQAMAFFIPLSSAMSILIFYALVRKVYDEKVSFIASVILATAFTDVILTAGVKGETYARPLYLLLIFLFLNQRLDWWKKTLLFTVTSISLVLTHYYTAILTVAILASMSLGTIVIRQRKGVSLEGRSLLLPAILTGSILMYFLFYANWAFDFISAIDWLSSTSYQAVLFSLTLWLALKPQSQNQARTTFVCFTVSVSAFMFAWLATRIPLVPSAPILPMHYLLYTAPLIATAPLCVLGYGWIGKIRSEQHAMPLFWLASVLGLKGYAIFGNVDPGLGLTLAYRGVNFLLPTLAILSALGVHRLYEYRRSRSRTAVKIVAVAVTLFIISTNVYSVYAAVHLEERYMGYFWLHRLHEYRAAEWLKETVNNQIVTGDVKTLYLLKYYFDVNVDVFQGLKYLTGADVQEPQVLLVYDQMLKNGYVVYGGYSVDLPSNWIEKASSLNLVYSNGLVNAYVK